MPLPLPCELPPPSSSLSSSMRACRRHRLPDAPLRRGDARPRASPCRAARIRPPGYSTPLSSPVGARPCLVAPRLAGACPRPTAALPLPLRLPPAAGAPPRPGSPAASPLPPMPALRRPLTPSPPMSAGHRCRPGHWPRPAPAPPRAGDAAMPAANSGAPTPAPCFPRLSPAPPPPSLAGVVGAAGRTVGLAGGQRPGSLSGAHGCAPAPASPCAR
nr:translation initiation factor IF-2-like [Aegilops tauschii subsp. strangulata]